MQPFNKTYRLIALAMAFLMFFTSVGFTIDLHYCRGELKTFSLIGKAKSCHEIGKGMKNCPHHNKMMKKEQSKENSIAQKGCCSNRTLHFQADYDQQTQVNNAVVNTLEFQSFVVAFVQIFLNSPVLEIENLTYKYYKPPLIARDIYVLLETYLL